ncbi:MAG: HNH endonuclease [Solirubrobacteraceae bacterium]
MLREATNAGFIQVRRFPVRRFHFSAGTVEGSRLLGLRAMAAIELLQADVPVAVADEGRRCYWWFRDRFWWEDDGLAAADVMALVLERESRARRRLERAHALMAGQRAPPLRTAIPLEVKRVVWERSSGRCAECGSAALLEFDHVIPLAMGGSSTQGNLQLLCADCNRVKGAAL